MIKPVKENDCAKLERIYEKYKNVMYKEAYSVLRDPHDSEDAVQQAILRIIRCIDRIREDEPGMTCNFLKIIVRNVAKDLYNKRIRGNIF